MDKKTGRGDDAATRRKPELPGKPAIGRDVEIENLTVEKIKAVTKYETSRATNTLALVVVLCSAASLAIAFIYGVIVHDLSYVGYDWAVVGPINAAVFGFYFRGDPKDTG